MNTDIPITKSYSNKRYANRLQEHASDMTRTSSLKTVENPKSVVYLDALSCFSEELNGVTHMWNIPGKQ